LLKQAAKPRQIEFSRLNLNYLVMSKRKLLALVHEASSTAGTIRACRPCSGMRRRGFTPRAHPPASSAACRHQQAGTRCSSSRCWKTEVRNDLDARAERRMAVVDPLKLVLTNLPIRMKKR
jgi:glutaminyl-tRNA synthetase